ncbi:hypothetical protein [Embleya sp. NPDC005575]|uniref:hypothetical protein n=1 Tax=Embleya sp. NPDC005575 TaxID=3156892 RepID=UPI0033A57374
MDNTTRCPAAHPDDTSPCEGRPDAVRILDQLGTETLACVRHGAILHASLTGPRVYPGPGHSNGDAIEVHKRAATLPPYSFARRPGDVADEAATYLRQRRS